MPHFFSDPVAFLYANKDPEMDTARNMNRYGVVVQSQVQTWSDGLTTPKETTCTHRVVCDRSSKL
jgi:hypothetical protein